MLVSVEGHLKSLRADVAQLEKEKDFSAQAKKDAISRRDDHRRFQKHYERRRRLLAIDEAKRVLAKAEDTRTQAESWLAALRAAHRRRRIEDCKRLIAGFTRQKQELEKAHEPDRKALERLGRWISDPARLERIREIENRIGQLTKSRNESATEQNNLQGELLQTTKEISGADQLLTSVRSFLNDESERRRLRDQGVLPPSETGAGDKAMAGQCRKRIRTIQTVWGRITVTDTRICLARTN